MQSIARSSRLTRPAAGPPPHGSFLPRQLGLPSSASYVERRILQGNGNTLLEPGKSLNKTKEQMADDVRHSSPRQRGPTENGKLPENGSKADSSAPTTSSERFKKTPMLQKRPKDGDELWKWSGYSRGQSGSDKNGNMPEKKSKAKVIIRRDQWQPPPSPAQLNERRPLR